MEVAIDDLRVTSHLKLAVAVALRRPRLGVGAAPAAADFPAADAGYHNDAEARAQIDQAIATHAAIAGRTVIGASYEGRELWPASSPTTSASTRASPRSCSRAGQHAREHLTVEMALYLIDELTSNYGIDPRIKGILDSREIWIIPGVNPDGSEYDITGTATTPGARTASPTRPRSSSAPTSTATGASSGAAAAARATSSRVETYRGASAFSAPRPRPCASSSTAA